MWHYLIWTILFTFNRISSKDCCKGGPHSDCPKLKTINECLGPKAYQLCKWYCYLKPVASGASFQVDISGTPSASTWKSKPKFEFTTKIKTALGEIITPSSYYEAYDIVSYDNTGSATRYKFHPVFVKTAKNIETFALVLIHQYIADRQLLAIQSAKSKAKMDSTSKLTTAKAVQAQCSIEARKFQGTNFSPLCVAQDVIGRRRLLLNDTINNNTNSRRRLETGAETDVDDRIGNKPYSATGLLVFTAWDADEAELSTFAGTGAVIASRKKHDGIYDYILTAGHNIYEKRAPDDNKYSTDIDFYLALNKDGGPGDLPDPDGSWAQLKRVWCPLFKGVDADYPTDFAVIEYKRPLKKPNGIDDNIVHPILYRTEAGGRWRRFSKMPTYRVYKQDAPDEMVDNCIRQRVVVDIIPINDAHAQLYTVHPEFTQKCQSGSPALIGDYVLNMIVGILVGSSNGDDVLTRLNRVKIDIINNIMIGDYEHHAEIERARIGYEDLMNNQYINDKSDKQEAVPVYYNYYDYNQLKKVEFLNFEIYAFSILILIFILLCICSVGGVAFAVFLYKYYINSKTLI